MRRKTDRGLGLSTIEEAVKAYEKRLTSPNASETDLLNTIDSLEDEIKSLYEKTKSNEEDIEALRLMRDLPEDALVGIGRSRESIDEDISNYGVDNIKNFTSQGNFQNTIQDRQRRVSNLQDKRHNLAQHQLSSNSMRALSPEYLQRDITRKSRERGNVGVTRKMAEEKGYFSLQEQFDNDKEELGNTEKYILEYTRGPRNETQEQRAERLSALQGSAQLRQSRVNDLGVIQGALRQKKISGMDPESVIASSQGMLEQASVRQRRESITELARSGGLGTEKEAKEKLLQAELDLAAAHKEYKEALESIGTQAEKTAEELDNLNSKVKNQTLAVGEKKEELSAVSREGGADKSSLLNFLGPVAALLRNGAAVYQHQAVTSEIGQSYGQAGLANATVNSRFFDAMNSGRDMGSMLRTIGSYDDIFGKAGKAFDTTGITESVKAAANAIDGAGSAISAFGTGNPFGGATSGINAVGEAAMSGINIYKGIPQSQQAADMASARKARFDAFTSMDAFTLNAAQGWGIDVAHSTRGFGSSQGGTGGTEGSRGSRSPSASMIAQQALFSSAAELDTSDISKMRTLNADKDVQKGLDVLVGSQKLMNTVSKFASYEGPMSPKSATSIIQDYMKDSANSYNKGLVRKHLGENGFDDVEGGRSAEDAQVMFYNASKNFKSGRGSRRLSGDLSNLTEFNSVERQKQAQDLLPIIQTKLSSPEGRMKLGEQLSGSGIQMSVDDFVKTITDGLQKVAKNGEAMFSATEKKALDVVQGISSEPSGSSSSLYKGGKGREAFVQALTNESWLAETIRTSGLSKEETLSAARTGRDTIGAEFVRQGPEEIRTAGRMAAHGYFSSADQYLGTRGMMSESMGNSKERLEEVMSAAVAKGMDSSKNIVALAQSSAAMASAYGARGIDAGAGTNKMLLGGWQAGVSAGMSPNMAVTAASQSAGIINSAAGNTSLNLTGVMEAQELMDMGYTDPRSISTIQKMDMTELSSMSDKQLSSLGIDPSQREKLLNSKRQKSLMSIGGGFMDNKIQPIIDKMKSGEKLTQEEQITYNQASFMGNMSTDTSYAQLSGAGYKKGSINKSQVVKEGSATADVEGLNSATNEANATSVISQDLSGNIKVITDGLGLVVSQLGELLPTLKASLGQIQSGKGGELGVDVVRFNASSSALGSAASKLDSAATKLGTYKP